MLQDTPPIFASKAQLASHLLQFRAAATKTRLADKGNGSQPTYSQVSFLLLAAVAPTSSSNRFIAEEKRRHTVGRYVTKRAVSVMSFLCSNRSAQQYLCLEGCNKNGHRLL